MKVDRVITQAIWEHQANTKGFPNNEYLNDLEKIRKALEIIKEKNVCIRDLKKSKTLEEYNGCREWEEQLTQEEYDLLKEMFL